MSKVNAVYTQARPHTVEIVCAKCDLSGLGEVSPEGLERVLQNAKVRVVFELGEEQALVPDDGAHTDDEIRAMFPEVTNSGGQFYMDRMLSGYRLLCSALKKGGYSVADKDVVTILMQADLMENVPLWKGISGTQEGLDLDTFLDQLRAKAGKGLRVSENALKACFGGLPGRLALHSAALN